jgi:Fe-S cluster assembly protein SufD
MTVSALSRPALEARLHQYPGDANLQARQAALEQFLVRGFPTSRDEDWKYTDLADVVDISHRALADTDVETPDTEAIASVRAAIDAHWLVIVNGQLISTLSDKSTEFEILPADGNQDIEDPLADLNAVLAGSDVTIRVAGDAELTKPIGLLFADRAHDSVRASHARVGITVASGGTAQFVEYHLSTGDADQYANVFIATTLEVGASVDYVRLQNRAPHHLQTARLNVSVSDRANFRHFGLDIGAALARNDLKIVIGGADALAEFNGLYVGNDEQHIDNHTRVDHRVGPAHSKQEYRGILAGKSRGTWNGKAVVHEGADGTDAEQANHNLLLSRDSEINAKPELEIYADDVKCSHGTTVGQLDDKAMFYLRSRGLGEEQAKRILTRAFAATVVNKVPISELRELIAEQVEQRLAEFGGGNGQ